MGTDQAIRRGLWRGTEREPQGGGRSMVVRGAVGQEGAGVCFVESCFVKLIIKANPRKGTKLESKPVCTSSVQSRAGTPAAWRATFL